ncbi:hypothetical protein, partial [Nocardia sp. JMUB6875]|uniref:hypothetical protein n=1 Tax=Nocardia sp. JMUB6875 TaxID=3158170 RepID=UPI0034E866A3
PGIFGTTRIHNLLRPGTESRCGLDGIGRVCGIRDTPVEISCRSARAVVATGFGVYAESRRLITFRGQQDGSVRGLWIAP